MELFKSIAANTEKQLTIVVSKKKDGSLIVLLKQDEITPYSMKGKPEQLDERFEQLYQEACEKFRNPNPSEEVTSNVDTVVETEKKQQEEEKKPAASKSTNAPKPVAKKEEIKSPLDEIRKKIEKCNKADAKKLLDITDRVKKSKDPDVRDFSIKELERYMEKCKFTEEEIKLWVEETKKNGIPEALKPATETGMFAGKGQEAEMVEVTEEEEEEPTEEKVTEPEPVPAKEEPKPVKEEPQKAAPKKSAPKKEEPKQEAAPAPAAGPEDDDLLF